MAPDTMTIPADPLADAIVTRYHRILGTPIRNAFILRLDNHNAIGSPTINNPALLVMNGNHPIGHLATVMEGQQWIDTVHSGHGRWTFVSDIRSTAPHPPHFLSALRAVLQLGFLLHDALAIARAWPRDGFDWPNTLADFPRVRHSPFMAMMTPSAPFPACPAQLGLYAIVPDAKWVERCVLQGVPTVQLRIKSHACNITRQIAHAADAVRGSSTRLWINDHGQATIDYGAKHPSNIAGVHLGQSDLATANLPAIHDAGLQLGVSTHGYAEILRVIPLRASYIALGSVFPTQTKQLTTPPIGIGQLRAYAALLYPIAPSLVAIGGITLETIAATLASGVGSVAVVRAITAANDVATSIAVLQAAYAKYVTTRPCPI